MAGRGASGEKKGAQNGGGSFVSGFKLTDIYSFTLVSPQRAG